ncbi:MAG: hypothetical protein HY289_04800 [Planctomycetes bacterium]|nr:hypothetical protein [Planctomycetota bacterium]
MSKPIQTNGTAESAQLTEELDRLRAELAKVKSERDAYRKIFLQNLPEEPPPSFTKEEALTWVGQAPPLGEFIAQLEREMNS